MRVEPKLKSAENSWCGTWMVLMQVDSAPGHEADMPAHPSGLWGSGIPHSSTGGDLRSPSWRERAQEENIAGR